jgi:hypothetical protein
MPTIAQAVASNDARIAKFGDKPMETRVSSELPSFSIPPANSLMALPSRGSLSPNLVVGSDFYTSAAGQFRISQRSSSPPPAQSVTKVSTPQSLINKKLVSPIIGGGTKFNRYNVVKTMITAALVTNGTSSSQVFTVGGVQAADTLIGYQWITKQAVGVVVLGIRVTGQNNITIDFFNPTAGSLTPTGGSISLFLVQ